MAKVCICLILTAVFSLLSAQSFLSNDYGPLRQWIQYYQEYRALQGALDKGNASKEELLEKLKAMYPERARELEDKFKMKYGDLKQDAQNQQDRLNNYLDSSDASLPDTLQTDEKSSSRASKDASRSDDAASRRDAPRSTHAATSGNTVDKQNR